LGASGDLGPLACVALVACGKWRARYGGRVLDGQSALAEAGLRPMHLGFKEGLALINGTSAMTGLAALVVEDCINLVRTYDVISCLTFEALKAKKKPFDPVVHSRSRTAGSS
jgi:histidine ammonia-lyase